MVYDKKHWMNTSEVGSIFVELYGVVFYVYWIDDGNTKKTISYRPDRSQEHHDGGFVSLLKTDKRYEYSVVRLFCDRNKYFQWVRWGTQMNIGDNIINTSIKPKIFEETFCFSIYCSIRSEEESLSSRA